MTTLIRRSLALPVLAALALGIAACSGDITGTATSTSNPPSDAPATSSGDPLASIDPCQLFDQSQLTQLGLAPGKHDNTSKARGCQWAKGSAYTVGIYLDGSQPIDAVGTDGASKVALQSHDAVQTTASGLGCDVEIAISATSSIDVAITSGSSPDDCEVAHTYAQLVEPKLPPQQK